MKCTYIRKCLAAILLAAIFSTTIACGETVSGVGKDVRRMGRGVRTIFIRDGSED